MNKQIYFQHGTGSERKHYLYSDFGTGEVLLEYDPQTERVTFIPQGEHARLLSQGCGKRTLAHPTVAASAVDLFAAAALDITESFERYLAEHQKNIERYPLALTR